MSQAAKLNEEGILLAQENRYEEAIGKFQAASALAPLDATAYANLARTYLLLRKPEEALVPAQKAVEFSKSLACKLLLVQTYFWLREERKAQAIIEPLLTENAENPTLFMALGDIALSARDFATAILRYQEVIRLTPNSDRAYVQIGRAYLWQEMEKMQKQQEMPLPNLEHPRAMMARMGNLMASGGMSLDRAGAAFRKAVYINPENVEGYILLGILAFQRTDYEEAALEWEEALRFEPKSVFLHMALGLNAQHKKDYITAESYFVKAGELAPQQNEPQLLRIFLRLTQKQYAEAVNLLLESSSRFATIEQEMLAALSYEKDSHVPWLLSLLAHHNSKIAEFSARALSHVSGQAFTRDAQVWQNWWREEQKKGKEGPNE
jgi:tetratricopeptide (TPR) repeat protein